MNPRLAPLPVTAAEPLALMHRACFPEDPWDAEAFARLLALHGVFGRLAWLGEAPAGFILARDLGEEAEILTLGVLPGMRRCGIGGMLLAAAVTEAGRRCLGSVVLEVAADNEAARRLYGAAGFTRAGTRPRYYRRAGAAIDALILRRPIAAEAGCARPGSVPD
jgi:ribosomal-protein-alanine N-acetyltransferase